jgi:hypothetical protein
MTGENILRRRSEKTAGIRLRERAKRLTDSKTQGDEGFYRLGRERQRLTGQSTPIEKTRETEAPAD